MSNLNVLCFKLKLNAIKLTSNMMLANTGGESTKDIKIKKMAEAYCIWAQHPFDLFGNGTGWVRSGLGHFDVFASFELQDMRPGMH